MVSQEDEAYYTAIGCYSDIEYDKNICVFIGGGGSIELIFVKNKEIIDKKFFDFGVVDITNKFDSLKEDIEAFLASAKGNIFTKDITFSFY